MLKQLCKSLPVDFLVDILLITHCSLVPQALPERDRKIRGEPGKIYHVRNVMGRDLNYKCRRVTNLKNQPLDFEQLTPHA